MEKIEEELDEIASSIYAQNIDKEYYVDDLEENFTKIVGSEVKWYDSKIDDGLYHIKKHSLIGDTNPVGTYPSRIVVDCLWGN